MGSIEKCHVFFKSDQFYKACGTLTGESAPMELNASRSMPSGAVGALCLLFTGGTFRSRCVVTSLASGNRCSLETPNLGHVMHL